MNNICLPFLTQSTVKLFLTILFFLSVFIYPQEIKINKIEPPNWWAGMNRDEVQLMVYGENLTSLKASFDNEDIEVVEIHKIDNPSYAFIDIEISSGIEPGTYKLTLENAGSKTEFNYPIIQRETEKENHMGFTPDDIIYLIMPDRFSNGDPSNDIVEGYEDTLDRSKGNTRHGGDLQGIINQLDYLKGLGITAIWLNPVLENNCRVSYHGYAATDLYKVDPRLGTNELYKQLISEAHKKGIKIILDHVANHIHINHQWMKNLPFDDWTNGSAETYNRTNHDKIAYVDIHGDPLKLENSASGWFTPYMPDLNQRNPYMANYIIQNTIWWMEYAGIDGIREDTYPYADAEFMAEWAEAILDEYPNTNIVGEVWKGDPVYLAAYQEQSMFTPDFDSKLPSVTDFGLTDALRYYLSGQRNLNNIYEILGMDFVYYNPDNLVTFIDNHDVTRAMFAAKEDLSKVKMALQILLTTRGIPQLYYGFEIGMVGGEDDGNKR
ncbi:MAG TPA: alpha-amylase family glycosyl hydrolase, partial [Ignavibacteriaceae bacterium]|nr:alpha-amylase family glycosyl hydrolase [Ignavibacteriaceae bacterium]